jgi:predicted NAD-dependent protein-ADP-ribosyltransferase YbiA (DUF1768 family)
MSSVGLLALFPSIDQMAETETKNIAAAGDPPLPDPPTEKLPLEAPKQPYEKGVLDSLLAFFRKRAKNQVGYTFTKDGDLEIMEGAVAKKKGKADVAGTIQLKRFLPLEPADRQALEEYRLETLADLDEKYEAEKLTLQGAWEDYKLSGAMRPVLAANQRVAELDARRSAVRSAVRDIVAIENPTIRSVILNELYDERKLFGKGDPFDQELMRMTFSDFQPEFDQGKYVADAGVAEAEAAAAEEAAGQDPNEMTYRQKLKDGRSARVFYDTDSVVNGFLSPMWQVDFTMDDTAYASAIQAYEAERARELGKEELRKSLLKTRSARTVRLMTRKVEGQPADAKGLWVRIYTAIYQQVPALKEKLLATGTDALIFADVREGPSGIGLAEKDSGVLDPAKWKGENAVGVAQETVRTRLREETLEEAPEAAAPKESVITEEQQAKAKVAAIINARKGRK